jgi:hypothetical protein
MLVLEEVFGNLVRLILTLLVPLRERSDRLLEILLFQVPFLEADHFVFLVPLDGFFEEGFLRDFVLL